MQVLADFSAWPLGFAIVLALASNTINPETALAQDEVVYASCKNDLQMTDSECECVVKAVNDTLNANQLAFFMASIQQDQSAMIAAQGQVNQNEMMELVNFMTTTPTNCKGK